MTLIMTSEMADQLVVIVIAGMQFLLQNVEIMEHGKKERNVNRVEAALFFRPSRSHAVGKIKMNEIRQCL